MTRGVPGHWFTDALTEMIRDIVQPRRGLVVEVYTDGVVSGGDIVRRQNTWTSPKKVKATV